MWLAKYIDTLLNSPMHWNSTFSSTQMVHQLQYTNSLWTGERCFKMKLAVHTLYWSNWIGSFLSVMGKAFEEQRRVKKKKKKKAKGGNRVCHTPPGGSSSAGTTTWIWVLEKSKCLSMTHCPVYTHHSTQATNSLESSKDNTAYQNPFGPLQSLQNGEECCKIHQLKWRVKKVSWVWVTCYRAFSRK